MKKRKNPFTGEIEDYPPPRKFLCPEDSRPTRETISAALGFTVPIAFVRLVEWVYDQANGDPYRCVEVFSDFVGLGATDGSYRYDSTPCELFPFAATGCDGEHYGYLVHAPELNTEDYPVCSFCPMDSFGVLIVGPGTYSGLVAAIAVWGKPKMLLKLNKRREHFVRSTRRVLKAKWDCPLFILGYRRAAFKASLCKERHRTIDVASVVAVPPDWTFLPSSDGVGVLAPSRLFGPPPKAINPYGPVEPFIRAADAAIKKGHPATALYYLREGYWFRSHETPIPLAERLRDVYTQLGRPSLAKVMQSRIDAWQKTS